MVVERDMGVDNQIIVRDTREALSFICAAFYHNAHKKLKIIGVTGTNGKTSTTYMIKKILDHSGKKTGLIGTVRYFNHDDEGVEADLTTPEPQQLYKMFYSMVKSGCEYCVMEVSSQALAQCRCSAIDFECAVFTNLSVDHLDYHLSEENYFDSKAKLFSQSRISVINADDKNATHIFGFVKGKALFFSAKNKNSDFYAENISFNSVGCRYFLKEIPVEISMPGEFSVYNSLGAIGCCNALGRSLKNCIEALKDMDTIPGRAEVLKTDTPYDVVIDYAHTPEGIKNILSAMKKLSEGRVVSLFGCGGNRDKIKRPMMAKAAAENSDYVIITTDNPRNENPDEIIEDILPGIRNIKTPCAVIPDRTYAIEYALKNAKDGDIIVLCGKGHETYQVIGDDKHPYDEREIVRRYLQQLR